MAARAGLVNALKCIAKTNTLILEYRLPILTSAVRCTLHTSTCYGYEHDPDRRPFTKSWTKYNEVVYPPQKEGELRRPSIRGMTIDEAMKQLSFHKQKGAGIVKQVLLEAQKLAVEEHNVEYKSNLWIADSFAKRGIIIKGLRKLRGPSFGFVHYRYCDYYVRLREGFPPKHYVAPEPSGNEKMTEYINLLRKRRIIHAL